MLQYIPGVSKDKYIYSLLSIFVQQQIIIFAIKEHQNNMRFAYRTELIHVRRQIKMTT